MEAEQPGLGIVVLAAGQGTRMCSTLPKVLHPLAGRPLLTHVLETARALRPQRLVVVYGYGGERVPQAVPEPDVHWVLQAEQLGTGHAVAQALAALEGLDRVLVLYGDVPLVTGDTLDTLVRAADHAHLALLTVRRDDPAGYGRIVRDAGGRVARIVEERDASAGEREIREINTGMMVVDKGRLAGWLQRIGSGNAQGEYYLTDLVALAVEDGVEVRTVHPMDAAEVEGVNDRSQLARLERAYQAARAEELMRQGVALLDPARFDLRGRLSAGQDVTIDVNVVLEGDVDLADGVFVGANTVIRNSRIGPGVRVLENCVIEDCVIGADCRIGPFARLRPETSLAEGAHVGNFVEIKKSSVGRGTKINHLSYVGDAVVGASTNIGAGTITCNYDGANKHQTVIGENAFIGSDTQLVAPVRVGAGATIGAGSTITRDAPPGKLTLSRSRQTTLDGWTRPRKGAKTR
ncbi:MAG: bifunctional UDP-N-acetylglucosamine diphosphorylase/glucosamine-1-phosphate N-acetyltransferase GlmU [Chromatiales bacterium]|jgi:bifunctional UDP-N-acetylglucosamine pyrophosphorylase/glucosamine-1-phosphate N-acetyltransferase